MVRWHRLAFVLLPFLLSPITSARAQNAAGDGSLGTTGALTQESTRWSVPDLSGLTPDALQGPPTLANLYAIVGMDEHQLAQYIAAYRAHMASTTPMQQRLEASAAMAHSAGDPG